jgi:iron complex outermembrane receptor protein
MKKVMFILITLTMTSQGWTQVQEGRCGALWGRVVDAADNGPVAGVQILLDDVHRSGMTHAEGHFFLPSLPLGSFTLQTFRIGYQNIRQPVHINICDTIRITIALKESPLEMQAIHISDTAESGLQAAMEDPDFNLEGRRLRQQLGRTIAETLADEPGLDKRSMGPAPARPILRGMGGDRLLVLEDRQRTGDLSATSADHAVVVEPMTAERIEVLRGPDALLYGPNTLGGVINVARGYIPTTHLDHIHGTATYQGESVNNGHAGGIAITSPIGPFSARLDASARSAEDIDTPTGRLNNSSLQTLNGSVGLALVKSWGFIGVAASEYESDYGIPGGFVGAHPNGVDISLERSHTELKAEFFPAHDWIRHIEVHGSRSRYYHQEIESSGILGVEFGLLTYNGTLNVFFNQEGLFRNGMIGVWAEHRDWAAGGLVFAPPTIERTLAGIVHQEMVLGKWALKGAFRWDSRQVTPEFEKESNRIGWIRARRFGNWSAAVGTFYQITPRLVMGSHIMRSFRAPGIEELYSEGPHLAAYSFEIGNPRLQEERGLGIDIITSYQSESWQLDWAVFRNSFDDYIFPRNTGQLNFRTLLPTYQFTGLDAVIQGTEVNLDWRISSLLSLKAGMSYVYGELTDSGEPLPWMPPLHGKFEVRFSLSGYQFGLRTRTAAEQNRLGEFEEYTAGYSIIDLFAQRVFQSGPFLSSLDLGIENLFDQEYRRHLSRVKSVMPEPGRNIKLLFRMYF